MRWFNKIQKKRYEKWLNFQNQLQIADIVFVRKKGAVSSWVIRKFTKSYWSHVALVFAVPNKKLLFNNYLIVEANRTGLEIHRIQKYTKRLDYYDIGIKRVPNIDKKTRKRVIAFMLNNVDKKYDLTRILGYLLRGFEMDLTKGILRFLVDKQDFVCSTFIQQAFYQAMNEKRKKDVIFQDNLDFTKKGKIINKENALIDDHLDYVSPKDIAKSKNAKWLYNRHI